MPSFAPNSIGHFDVSGPDAATLQVFYERVFGWVVVPKGPGYALVETPEGSPNGAILEAETTALTIGVVVADLDAALGAATLHGGEVCMPITDNGWVKKAMLRDPAGNTVTVIQG
jgi:predicted enzyme related to lactoylglutathione lyase